jgi:hypothetical protein
MTLGHAVMLAIMLSLWFFAFGVWVGVIGTLEQLRQRGALDEAKWIRARQQEGKLP